MTVSDREMHERMLKHMMAFTQVKNIAMKSCTLQPKN